MKSSLVAGADGCRAGWIAVTLDRATGFVGCRLAPSAPDAHLLRARLLRSRSQWTAARNAYERVLHLDPDHREALAGLQAISSVCDA